MKDYKRDEKDKIKFLKLPKEVQEKLREAGGNMIMNEKDGWFTHLMRIADEYTIHNFINEEA